MSHPAHEGQVKGQFRRAPQFQCAPQKQTRSRRSLRQHHAGLGSVTARAWQMQILASGFFNTCVLPSSFSILSQLPLLQRKSGKGENKSERRARKIAKNHPLHGTGEPKDGAVSPEQVVLVPRSVQNSLTSTYQSTFLSPSSYHLTITIKIYAHGGP